MLSKPPEPRGPAGLHHWLRTVIRRRVAVFYRNIERGLADPLDLDTIDVDVVLADHDD